MRRFLSPFMLTLSVILLAGYAYVAWRLTSDGAARLALALPFLMVWLVPAVYWVGGRDSETTADELVHAVSYLCMGWLNFLVLFTLARDVLLGAAWAVGADGLSAMLRAGGSTLVFAGSIAALAIGILAAFRGPHLKRVDIPIAGLHPAFEGLRIVQISDLHVGPTIGMRYVQRVVEMSNALDADFVVLTGDIVDGPVSRLAPHVAPLSQLRARQCIVFILGNHDCYSGAGQWIAHFRSLGMQVLLNEHLLFERDGGKLVLGGVVDPALGLGLPGQGPRPDLAAAPDVGAAVRILLAHNPSLAPRAQEAGFDLQLSGHTHAGQFFPWTLAVRMAHAPHVSGLSRLGKMWVYVNAGTGSWGPPVRFGTEPELTLLRLTSMQ